MSHNEEREFSIPADCLAEFGPHDDHFDCVRMLTLMYDTSDMDPGGGYNEQTWWANRGAQGMC